MILKKFYKQFIFKLKTALWDGLDCILFYMELTRRMVELNHYPFSRIHLDIKQWPEPSGDILPILRDGNYSKNNNLSQDGEVISNTLKRYVVQLLIPSYLDYNTTTHTVKSASITIPQNETREVVDIITDDAEDRSPYIIIRAGKNARATYVFAVFGNREIVKDVTLELEECAEGRIIGVIIGSGTGRFILKTTLRHSAPHTKGDIKIKMVLKDTAYVSYDGLIKIDKSAQQTNSYLDARVLILDRGAKCDGKPELEIEADDVKASHAFSSGKIDSEQLFYLCSRGLTEAEAKQMIVKGFLMEAAEGLSHEAQECIKREIVIAL